LSALEGAPRDRYVLEAAVKFYSTESATLEKARAFWGQLQSLPQPAASEVEALRALDCALFIGIAADDGSMIDSVLARVLDSPRDATTLLNLLHFHMRRAASARNDSVERRIAGAALVLATRRGSKAQYFAAAGNVGMLD